MSHSTLRSGSHGDQAEEKVVHSHPSLDWVAKFQAADDSVSVRRFFAGPYVSRLEVREERPVSALPADGVTLPLEVYDPLGEVAGGGHSVRRAGLFSYHAKASVQLVAISLSNISFCLAVAAFPMRVSGIVWYVTFIATGVAAWSGALFFLWQKRESTNERFQAFVLQEGFVYSRMIEIYIWTWIGILYCLYVAGLTLATLPLHFDSATLPGSRGYMWVLNLFLSFPHLLAFDPVSSTKAFKEAAVRKGYPGAAHFHDGYLSRTALLAAIVSVFAGLWVLACSPVGLFAQSDYDLYALYAVTALNVVLMFQILPRYANMCKSADALVHAERRRWKRVDRNVSGKHGTLNQQARELRRPPSHMSSRVGEVVLAAVSTRMAFDQDATENSIGAASFRWGRNKGPGLEDGTRRERADSHKQWLLPGEDEQSHHGMRWALRQTWNPLVTVALGLWSMPHGTVMLVLNVTASIKHVWHTWRWLAATRPEKFLLAAGYLIAGLFLWPVLEVKLTDNAASMICNGLAFVLTLSIDLAMVSGRLSKADQEMILHAAEEGENVGSGLVFSTASLLNALVSGGSLAAGYVATEERLVDSAAISCRWDTAASWVLTVEQTAGRPPLKCTIMFSREQLHRAALVAWRDSCRFMWIDTLSVPQPSPDDDPQLAARKEALLRRLVPTMTSVYATVRHVLIVETECGLELGPNCYSGRTWTLQECVINPRTAVVQLYGMLSILGPPSKRLAYTGLDPTFSTEDLDDLGSYLWVLSGEERHAAQSTTPTQRAAFQGFANTRSAARSADKAVALGQIYFRMLFEHADVATRFMHEVAVLLAEQDGPPLLLIDNTGWEPGTMSGSADPGRVLMGRPGPLECGDLAVWTFRRLPPADRVSFRMNAVESVANERITPHLNDSSSRRKDGDTFANFGFAQGVPPPVATLPGQVDSTSVSAHTAESFALSTNYAIPKPASILSALDSSASADTGQARFQAFLAVSLPSTDSTNRLDMPNNPSQPHDSVTSQPSMLKPELFQRSGSSPAPTSNGEEAPTVSGPGANLRRGCQDVAHSTARVSFASIFGDDSENEWWLCKLYLRRTVVSVAIKPGSMDCSGQHPCGFLWQMRTCTEAEKAQLESSELEKLTVTWL